jgi:Ca-activated chloride channel family protein
VLVQEAGATLFTIAKDVKIQVEFNPLMVSQYRLVGYESRMLKREDFNNDKVDAGEVGAGHAVTAIYEITPAGVTGPVDDLRYGAVPKEAAKPSAQFSGEYGFLKMRYKLPEASESKLITTPITASLVTATIESAPADVRFAVAVAGFGQLLKNSPHTSGYGMDSVLKLADGARGKDSFGYRSEFVQLVHTAKSLQGGVYPMQGQGCAPGVICD